MKKIDCAIDCRALGRYESSIIVDDDCNDEDINKAVEDRLDYFIEIYKIQHIDCRSCIHMEVCGVKPEDENGCQKWTE